MLCPWPFIVLALISFKLPVKPTLNKVLTIFITHRIPNESPGLILSGLIFGRMFKLVYRGAYFRAACAQEGFYSRFYCM